MKAPGRALAGLEETGQGRVERILLVGWFRLCGAWFAGWEVEGQGRVEGVLLVGWFGL